MERYFIQTLEYENNPYFNSTSVTNNFSQQDDVRILELINSLDAVINFVVETKVTDAKSAFLNSGNEYLNELRDILDQRSKKDPELNASLLLIHQEVIRLAEKYIENTTANDDYVPLAENLRSKQFSEGLASLKVNGFL